MPITKAIDAKIRGLGLCEEGAMLSGNSLLAALWRTSVHTAVIILLGACAANSVKLADVASQGGYVLHDENTTPRFWQRGIPSDQAAIATLYTDGANVFLDGTRLDRKAWRIRNGAHVRTGAASGALVVMEPASRGYDCRVEVREIMEGRILGGNGECLHILETPQGEGISRAPSTEYHVGIIGEMTELTIVQGRMMVRLRSDPARAVLVNRFEEVLLTAGGIIGPRPVPPEEVERRISWSNRFSFQPSSDSQEGAAAAAFGLFLKSLLNQDSGANDRPPRQEPKDQPAPTTEPVVDPVPARDTLRYPVDRYPIRQLPVERTPPEEPVIY